MKKFIGIAGFVALMALIPFNGWAARLAHHAFHHPQPVIIESLPTGAGNTPISTEESFISRDGRFLFFNSGKEEGHKDLHYARRIGHRWVYQHPLGPNVNTPKKVQGNPTMDRHYNFYFVDTEVNRMVQSARFVPETGLLSNIREFTGVPKRNVRFFARKFIDNMGVEASADGRTIYFSRTTWRLYLVFPGKFLDSDLLLTEKQGNRFVYNEAKARRIMQHINTSDLEYAACISKDGRELFFARLPIASSKSGKIHSMIMRATRPARSAPFGTPKEVRAIGHKDFVEAPTLSSNGRELYYHKFMDKKFRLFKVAR